MRNVASFDKSKNGDNIDVNGNDNMDDNVEDNIDANIADNVDVSDDKSVELNYLFLFYGIGVKRHCCHKSTSPNTILVLPEASSPQENPLALWLGMRTSGGNLIQAFTISFLNPAAQLSITPPSSQNLQPLLQIRPYNRNIARKLPNRDQEIAKEDKQPV
ncbi:hypothetical protein AO1008_02189 [Aspergillus oryzae 100-8]|uniref:Uncharacterized protein n=1 Tax=Aspergillus oryzae (strain 3.042) TaxID=1160506 RepID=I8TPL0_ASPO3|nr:hypothetical protein Ao3042_07861 [Aspergillus oryzae 3.042]KDE76423.1 hypothetical protein AO1008_02189 [Aspergillus oryzae 100-8]|eukprot:EIT76165.1 hypothetical protein Ao3042_07861 [Aspergillus oryzae 3.042]